MRGKGLKVGDIFVIVSRGRSLIYKRLKGGKIEQLRGDTSGVVKFRPLEDFEESELKIRLNHCDVVRIDRAQTGFFSWVDGFRVISRSSS